MELLGWFATNMVMISSHSCMSTPNNRVCLSRPYEGDALPLRLPRPTSSPPMLLSSPLRSSERDPLYLDHAWPSRASSPARWPREPSGVAATRSGGGGGAAGHHPCVVPLSEFVCMLKRLQQAVLFSELCVYGIAIAKIVENKITPKLIWGR
jgi:hypothetical protein